MKNSKNLPEWLVEVVGKTRNQYSPGEETDYSATSLIVPPMIYALEKKYQPEDDVNDALSAFLGTAMHDKIEEHLKDNPRYLVEKRYYKKIHVPDSPTKKDFVVSAQIDLYDKETKTLSDHKLSKMYSFQHEKEEYEIQLNIQAWLLRDQGYDPQYLRINGFAKDWGATSVGRSKDYPESMYIPVSFPLWEDEDVEAYIRNSILEKEYAKLGQMIICTDKQRWARPASYKVKRKGRKTAIRCFDTQVAAEEYIRNMKKPTGKEYVEYVPGEDVRCKHYCKVNKYCNYYIERHGDGKKDS